MAEEPRFIQKRMVPGRIDVHPREQAIIVHYQTDAVMVGERNRELATGRNADNKRTCVQ
jgi:hypothetical protein